MFQLNTPVRNMKLSGKPTLVDSANHIYRYTLTAGCEKNQLKAEAGFNWRDKELDTTLSLNG